MEYFVFNSSVFFVNKFFISSKLRSYPDKCSKAYISIDPWPFDNTNLSLLGQLGFLGSILALFLFYILIIQLVKVSKNARTNFESLIVIGIASTFLFQIIINLFMTIGLGPVTGIPLPFMSYGRTSLLINFISIGLALSALNRSRSLRNQWNLL